MGQSRYALDVEAKPIQALVIQPDNSYALQEIEQSQRAFQEIVGGYFEVWATESCILWFGEDAPQTQPCNSMATYLWWKLCPEMEGQGPLCGTVFVTGPADNNTDPTPVPDDIVKLYEHMEQIRRKEEGE